jgi:hypothetical protein
VSTTTDYFLGRNSTKENYHYYYYEKERHSIYYHYFVVCGILPLGALASSLLIVGRPGTIARGMLFFVCVD